MHKLLWRIKLWWLHRKINKNVLNRHFWAVFIQHTSLPINIILGSNSGTLNLSPPSEKRDWGSTYIVPSEK